VRALLLNGLRKQVEDQLAGQDLDMRRREASSPGQFGHEPAQGGEPQCDGHHKMFDLAAAGEPIHSDGESVAAVWPHQRLDGPFAGLMEKIMSKTSDEPRELRDAELALVSGGMLNLEAARTEAAIFQTVASAFSAVLKSLGDGLSTMAQK
jgi:hypothetical protein